MVRRWTGRFQERIAANPAPALRFGILAALLIALVLVVPQAVFGQRAAWLLLASPAVLVALAVLVRWPDLIFPLMVVTGLLVPFAVGTGSQTGINASALLLMAAVGLWVLDIAVGRTEFRLDASPIFPPLLALAGVSVLALGFGQLPWFVVRPAPLTAQVGGLAIILLSIAAFLYAAMRLTDLKPLRWMVYLFLGLGAVFILGVLIPSTRGPAIGFFQRAVRDAMFWTWMVALGLGQALLNSDLPRPWRIACGAAVLGAFYFTIVDRQTWTSGWLPALVAALVLVAIHRPKWLVVAALIGLAVLVVAPGTVQVLFLGGDNAYSLETRLAAWEIVLRIARLNPLLGLGPANYYNYSALFPILGYSVRFNSHNNYVDLLAQIGVAGLACFAWFAVMMGRFLWQIRDRMPEGFPRAYVGSVLAGFAGILVAGMLGDWLLPFVYNVGLEGLRAGILGWMFLGAAVAVERLVARAPSGTAAGIR